MEIDINKPFGEIINEIAKQWRLDNFDNRDFQVKVLTTLTSKNIAEFAALINNKS